jgi:AcrR family transcriptional regulator
MKSQKGPAEANMPLTRFERLDPDRRQRLLAAAAREFAFEGYETASLARIAEEMGVSKPSLYYYFEDKADLYATVVREAWRRLSPQGHVDLQSLDSRSFWPASPQARSRRCSREAGPF